MLTHLEVEDRLAPATWDNPGPNHARHPSRRCCKWPAISDVVMRLSAAQLVALFEGLDWRRV